MDKRRKISLAVIFAVVANLPIFSIDSDAPLNALSKASIEGDKAEVEQLLRQGGNIDTDLDSSLFSAALSGHNEIIMMLLDHGADIHALDDTALSWAAMGGHIETVRLLINRGARLNEMALIAAAGGGHTDIVALLLNNGADPHARNGEALQKAVKNRHKDTADYLRQHMTKNTAPSPAMS